MYWAGPACVLLMMLPGVPSIYAGDELGYVGLKTEGWDGDDAIRPQFPNPPTETCSTLDTYRALISIRRRYSWVHAARTETVELTNTRFVFRTYDGDQALTVELDLVAGGGTAVIRDADTVLFTS